MVWTSPQRQPGKSARKGQLVRRQHLQASPGSAPSLEELGRRPLALICRGPHEGLVLRDEAIREEEAKEK